MILAGDSIEEYERIGRLSIEDYLIKFERYISDIETQQRDNLKQKYKR